MSFGFVPRFYVPRGQVDSFDHLIASVFDGGDFGPEKIDGLHQVRCVAVGRAYYCSQAFLKALAPMQGFYFTSLPRDASNTPKTEHLYIGFVHGQDNAEKVATKLNVSHPGNVTFRDIKVIEPYPTRPGPSSSPSPQG